jgi:hypothetical protein
MTSNCRSTRCGAQVMLAHSGDDEDGHSADRDSTLCWLLRWCFVRSLILVDMNGKAKQDSGSNDANNDSFERVQSYGNIKHCCYVIITRNSCGRWHNGT